MAYLSTDTPQSPIQILTGLGVEQLHDRDKPSDKYHIKPPPPTATLEMQQCMSRSASLRGALDARR